MTNLEFDDDLDELLSDPGILNNHAKLMQMKVTKKDLDEGSSKDWLVKSDLLLEMVLQDTSVNDAYQKLLDSEGSADPDDPRRVITALMENMKECQDKCLSIITAMKNKPFWTPNNSETIFGSKGQNKVEKWMQVLDSFGKTFSQAKTLRLSRSSILPNEKRDTAEIVIVISRFKEILSELETLSQVVDLDLESDKRDVQ